MTITTTPLESVLETLKQLRPEELAIVESNIVRAKAQAQESVPSNGLLDDGRFMISFDDYLAMTDDERDEIQHLAFENYLEWIDSELEQRRAKWILVCGGKIWDSSTRLRDYPTEDKLVALGKQLGYAPLVFVAAPIIEESSWKALPWEDFYPSLEITLGADNWTAEVMQEKGLEIEADLDTGSGETLFDYDLLKSRNVVPAQGLKHSQTRYHLGHPYAYYTLTVKVSASLENGQTVSNTLSAFCVRNWQRSPLCLVNSFRKALAGRNLLLELPLRVELDGRNCRTKILADA